MIRPQLIVIGGGLAGLQAAIHCADSGAQVTLPEPRVRLCGHHVEGECEHCERGCARIHLRILLRTVVGKRKMSVSHHSPPCFIGPAEFDATTRICWAMGRR